MKRKQIRKKGSRRRPAIFASPSRLSSASSPTKRLQHQGWEQSPEKRLKFGKAGDDQDILAGKQDFSSVQSQPDVQSFKSRLEKTNPRSTTPQNANSDQSSDVNMSSSLSKALLLPKELAAAPPSSPPQRAEAFKLDADESMSDLTASFEMEAGSGKTNENMFSPDMMTSLNVTPHVGVQGITGESTPRSRSLDYEGINLYDSNASRFRATTSDQRAILKRCFPELRAIHERYPFLVFVTVTPIENAPQTVGGAIAFFCTDIDVFESAYDSNIRQTGGPRIADPFSPLKMNRHKCPTDEFLAKLYATMPHAIGAEHFYGHFVVYLSPSCTKPIHEYPGIVAGVPTCYRKAHPKSFLEAQSSRLTTPNASLFLKDDSDYLPDLHPGVMITDNKNFSTSGVAIYKEGNKGNYITASNHSLEVDDVYHGGKLIGRVKERYLEDDIAVVELFPNAMSLDNLKILTEEQVGILSNERVDISGRDKNPSNGTASIVTEPGPSHNPIHLAPPGQIAPQQLQMPPGSSSSENLRSKESGSGKVSSGVGDIYSKLPLTYSNSDNFAAEPPTAFRAWENDDIAGKWVECDGVTTGLQQFLITGRLCGWEVPINNTDNIFLPSDMEWVKIVSTAIFKAASVIGNIQLEVTRTLKGMCGSPMVLMDGSCIGFFWLSTGIVHYFPTLDHFLTRGYKLAYDKPEGTMGKTTEM